MPRIAGLDAGQTFDTAGEMIVGVGPIDNPPAGATAVAGGETEAAVELREVGVFHADEVEFGGRGKDGIGAFVVAFETEALGQAYRRE